MQFLKVENNLVILGIELLECTNCHGKMIKWSERNLNSIEYKLRLEGIYKESYGNFGICDKCIKRGGYPKECTCCGKDRRFPEDFKYQLTEYAKFPDDDADFSYICTTCVKERPEEVMDLLAESDDVEEIKHDSETKSI